MPKFKIGDRVRFNPKRGNYGFSLTFCFNDEVCKEVMKYPFGTVRGFGRDDIIVEFDYIQIGHDCNGIVSSCKGLYIDSEELVLIRSELVIPSISNLI